jgi:hypothetical protein
LSLSSFLFRCLLVSLSLTVSRSDIQLASLSVFRDSYLWRLNFSTALIFFCTDLRSVKALNTNPPALRSLNSSTLLCTQLYVVFVMLYVLHFYSLPSRSDTRDVTSRHCNKGHHFVSADCIVNSSGIAISWTSAWTAVHITARSAILRLQMQIKGQSLGNFVW